MKKEFRILGLMSGTSLDGLDMALCRFYFVEDSWKFEVEKTEISNYSNEVREKLNELPGKSAQELVASDVWFAEVMAKKVNSFLIGVSSKPDFIASHGQTIFHRPDLSYTFQLGSGAVLSVKTGIPVVCDFRRQDVALNGQGAPLVPKGDRDIFSGFDAFLNIGGFANVSINGKLNKAAFDICPANMLLNSLSALEGLAYDNKGLKAAEGSILHNFASDLENIPLFYNLSNPLSLGREYFDQWYLPLIEKYRGNKLSDLLHTATAYIASQIQKSLNDVCGKILVSGGGAHNESLIKMLRRDDFNEYMVEDRIITDFKESIVFAYLGLLRWLELPNTLVEATGAERVVSGGCIYLP